jgi:hypothetical protein
MNTDTEKLEMVSVPLIDEHFTHVGQAHIYEQDNKFVLYWSDGMVNEWSESFATFHLALSRLSVLHYAVGAGKFFANTPHDFASHADDFLKSQILESN